MSTEINGVPFDHRKGDFPLPVRSSRVFTSPTTAHVGAQVLPKASTRGIVRLSRYDDPTYMLANRDIQLNSIGQVIFVTQDGVQLHQNPYRVRYYVEDVRLVVADIIPGWFGYRDGVLHNHAPASRVICDWYVYAIPAF